MVSTSRRRLCRTALIASTTLLVAAGLAPTAADAAPTAPAPPSRASLQARAGASDAPSLRSKDPGVMANLFEWNWDSVSAECTNVLGPAGFGGVQVAPPQDSLKRTGLGNGSDLYLHPWWEVYQPVDYDLTSRMGNEQQFQDMVSACRSAGVKVYVDAVINHGTGQGNTSYGGKTYDEPAYNQPDVPYTPANFHVPQKECPSSDGGIQDYNNLAQVTRCNLVGLHDLRTETPYVQDTLAAYLNKLIGYGVSGFRVDAAKHIAKDDLDAIYAKLHRTKDGTRPAWALEVFGGAPGSLSPQSYISHGSVLGLDGVKQIRDAFNSYDANHVGSIATLKDFGVDSGLTPGSRTWSFVQNHDTERNGDALNYKTNGNSDRSDLATEWLLASGYGTPQVYAGFTWKAPDDPSKYTNNDDKTGNSSSPPADGNGMVTDTNCANGDWYCTDRVPGVLAMVGWHNVVGSSARKHWYDDGANVIAFSRGSKGWVAFNNNKEGSKTITVQTGMRKGTYCDVIHGGTKSGRCTGPTVTVSGSGKATVKVSALDAVAFTKLDRL